MNATANDPAATNEKARYLLRNKELRFVGKPNACVGELHLVNLSDEKVRVKKIPFVDRNIKGPIEASIDGLNLFARLMPGGSAQVTARIELPPQTPPGRYRGEALIGDRRSHVVIDVLESWEIAIAPTSMSIKVGIGEKLKRTIQLTNRGNVAWKTPKAAFVTLQEVDGAHRSLFQALKKTKENNYETVLNEWTARLRDAEIDPGVLKVVSGPAEIAAGESAEVEIEISFPEKPKRHRQYVGNARFEHAELSLDLEWVESAGTEQKENNEQSNRSR